MTGDNGGGRKDINLIEFLAEGSGDGLTDLSGHILLLCYILHQVVYLVNVPKKTRENVWRKVWY